MEKQILKCIIVIGLSFSYFIYSNLISINYYFAIGVMFFLIFLLLLNLKKTKINRTEGKTYLMILVPEIMIIIYSFLIIMFQDDNNLLKNYLSRALLFISTAIGSIAIIRLFKKDSIDILFSAAIINYFFYIIIAIGTEGITGIVNYMKSCFLGSDTVVKSVLEAHEITFVFGLFFIFFLLFDYKKNKRKTVVALVLFLLGFKRIGIIASIVSIIFYFVIKNIKDPKILKKIFLISSIILISATVIWLYFIKSGVIFELSRKYNINFMGRLSVYSLISNEYSISPFFTGKGLGYITYWGEKNIFYTQGTALHSGVIQMFVENGCIVYILYLINKSFGNTIRILNDSKTKNSKIYFSLIIYIILLWFTDNVATYLNFILVANSIFLYIMNYEKVNTEECSSD